MSIINEIHTWSKTLPIWQQDAISKLYVNRELTSTDLDDLYALAKSEAGIMDPENRSANVLPDTQFGSQPIPDRLVELISIKAVSNINAIADGSVLPIAQKGLTVIYGDNGAGKSGYTRALKHACRARDQKEQILPNANLDSSSQKPIEATFEVIIDGILNELPWRYKSEAPEPLSELAIFDSHCARAYIDNEGDFAYAPYGLDILEGLVKVCNTLRQRAETELALNAPNNSAYVHLINGSTSVGKALSGIPKLTKPTEIERLSNLSNSETERLALLNKALTESDPKQKSQALRIQATRLQDLASRLDTATQTLSNQKLTEIQDLVQKSQNAKNAAELAAKNFLQTPGQLPETGGEEWKALFEAAKAFIALPQIGHSINDLSKNSLCPLCQNPLGIHGVDRLKHFEMFVQQEAEKLAKEARSNAITAYRAIESAPLDLMIDSGLQKELSDLQENLVQTCNEMQACLYERKTFILKACSGAHSWDDIPALPRNPADVLLATNEKLLNEAKALESTIDEKSKTVLLDEYTELEARRLLSVVKAAVLQSISQYEYCAKLTSCLHSMQTSSISRKSTELSKTIATQELANALTAELKSLNVHQMKVFMKPESPRGKTQFKLTLQLPGGGKPSAILSEGEQRAIAIASFLAEVKLGNGRGAVIFDDPVSSLDHKRRWEVAERLANEAKERQVILFTHDVYFLCILEQSCEKLGTPLTKQFIRKTSSGYGVCSENLPFDIQKTKERIKSLRLMLEQIRAVEKDGDEELQREMTSRAFGHLRLTWERSIEEVLFNGTITRFGEAIHTSNLRSVEVTDDDYRVIYEGMTLSSKFEHDAASRANRLPIPSSDRLSEEIEKLNAWQSMVFKRYETVRAKR